MNSVEDTDQFQLLEEKIDGLIEMVRALRRDKESFAQRFQIQEKKLSELTEELEALKTIRDKARQKVVSLLEKIEKLDI